HVEEEEEDELYRDVNINQGRGLQASLEVEDSHVILTLVNPDGMESIFETTLQLDVPTPTSVAPLPITTPTIISSTIATTTITSQAPILPTTVSSDIIQNLPNFGSLFCFDDRLRSLEANFSKFRTVDENIKKITKEQVKEQVKKMEGNKSIQHSDEQRNLYKALVEAYESNKLILDTYGETVTLKRRRDDDVDKDEEPSVGPDKGSKRHREGKELESASALTETATRSAGRSSQASRSRQASASKSTLAEEPMQNTSQMEEPFHSEFDADRDWNKTLPTVHGSIHPWISELAKQADSHSSFNELMDTPLDFSNFLMNRLRVETLTPELLARPTYELMKGSCKSLIELKYHLEEIYKATKDQLDWVNPKDYEHIKWIKDLVPRTMWINEPIGYNKHALWEVSHWRRKCQQFYGFADNRESARDVYSKRRIIAITELKIVEWYSYKHLDWITIRRDDDKIYKFKEGDFKRLRIQDIEDMLLLLRRVEDLQLGVKSYQKKLNLTKPDSYRSDLKRKEAYTTYSNPLGFIYQNKDKKNRLMRIDELHKFSDETLTDVRTALDDRLKRIWMQYLPQTIWRKSDKDRAAAIIQAIDKRMKKRRIMRSLERFIGGKLYKGDFMML
nr:hypothetical protein [Tanacetum cinerariifolium]